MSRHDGMRPGKDYVCSLLYECRQEREILGDRTLLRSPSWARDRCDSCPQVLYGMEGLWDTVCSCENHKHLLPYQQTQIVLEEVGEKINESR